MLTFIILTAVFTVVMYAKAYIIVRTVPDNRPMRKTSLLGIDGVVLNKAFIQPSSPYGVALHEAGHLRHGDGLVWFPIIGGVSSTIMVLGIFHLDIIEYLGGFLLWKGLIVTEVRADLYAIKRGGLGACQDLKEFLIVHHKKLWDDYKKGDWKTKVAITALLVFTDYHPPVKWRIWYIQKYARYLLNRGKLVDYRS